MFLSDKCFSNFSALRRNLLRRHHWHLLQIIMLFLKIWRNCSWSLNLQKERIIWKHWLKKFKWRFMNDRWQHCGVFIIKINFFLLDQNRYDNKNLIHLLDSQQNLFTVVSARIKLEIIPKNQITWIFLYLKPLEEI